MNPSNSESGMELPPPLMEQAPPAMPDESAPQAFEQATAGAAEQTPAPQAGLPPQQMVNLPIPPIAAAPQAPPAAVSSTTAQPSVPLADDGDLIEKEWVDKAKRIVDQTRDDPYKQSEELTEVKADYMQKRYNKTIKLNK